MLSLMLMRHGKSDWYSDVLEDKSRPLNPRGVRSSKKMGKFIRQHDLIPERVLCSPAHRCETTLTLMMESAGWSNVIDRNDAIYEASGEGLLEVLQSVGSTDHSLMLVGHEPGLSSLIRHLCGGAGTVSFPTATLAILKSDAETWAEIQNGTFQLETLISPKYL
jgi:phosphohistidine phosphatase